MTSKFRSSGPVLRLGITYRLILYMLLVAAVPVALIAVFAFRAGSDGIQRHTNFHLTSVVSILGRQVEQWILPIQRDSQLLADVIRDQGGVAGPRSNDGFETVTNSVLESNPSIWKIDVIGADRETSMPILAATRADESASTPALSDQPAAVISPYTTDGLGKSLAFSLPISSEGEKLGWIVVHATTEDLIDAFHSDAGLGDTGKIYLIDRMGAVLTPVVHPAGASGPFTVVGPTHEPTENDFRGLRYRDVFGAESVGTVMPIQGTDWSLVAELPVADAFSDIGQMRLAIGGASGAFFVLIVVAATLIGRRVTRPVKTLSAGAQRIGLGELDHRIKVPGKDELGRLADSFNSMAADLEVAQVRTVEAERAAAVSTFNVEKVRQLSLLSKLGLSMALESDIRDVLEKYPSMARDISGADVVGIFVEGEGETCWHVDTGPDIEDGEVRLISDPRVSWLTVGRLEGPSGITQDGAGDGHVLGDVLGAPVIGEDGVSIGTVVFANLKTEDRFSEEDTELASIVAGYISATIQKIRKAESLQDSEVKARRAFDELKETQEQLIQSQKMESVGRLAGGIAHDFNNLLTPIIGYAELGALALTEEQDRLRSDLEEIRKAGEQAANLTRQLLAFSRRQVIEPKVIDVNRLIEDTENILTRVIGEDVTLETSLSRNLGRVNIDPGQVEQILMNLAVNARDAMPRGGKLTIDTRNAYLDSRYARSNPDVTAGNFICLSVTDTGTGIPEDVRAHIFEPFFTTKSEGQGTGLGLATCYGIAVQNSGHIAVHSEVGVGTTFRVYLPRVDAEEAAQNPANDQISVRGTETVLLIEDEDGVRDMAARILSSLGYEVREAGNGVAALEMFSEDPSFDPDLIVTDVVMPEMGGREVAERILVLRPKARVLFTSGYTDDAIARHGVLESGTHFIEKPFSPQHLAEKVRALLDRS